MGTQLTEQPSLSPQAKRHAKQIRLAWDNVGRSLWEYLSRLHDAWTELEDDINAREFAEAIGISPPQLSKHLKIARNPLIIANRRKLPAAETSLYILAQIYDDCKRFNRNDPDKKFLQIIDRSSSDKTIEFFAREREKLKTNLRKARGSGVLQLNNEHEAKTIGNQRLPWKSFLESSQVYSTFFINCSSDFLDLVAASENDFSSAFPLANKRVPSQKTQSHCFIFAPTKRIKDAATLLDCCGFDLQEIYSSTRNANSLNLLGTEVLLHGVYGGRFMSNVSQSNFDSSLAGSVALAESFADKSRIMFFGNDLGRDWIHCSPSLNEIEGF